MLARLSVWSAPLDRLLSGCALEKEILQATIVLTTTPGTPSLGGFRRRHVPVDDQVGDDLIRETSEMSRRERARNRGDGIIAESAQLQRMRAPLKLHHQDLVAKVLDVVVDQLSVNDSERLCIGRHFPGFAGFVNYRHFRHQVTRVPGQTMAAVENCIDEPLAELAAVRREYDRVEPLLFLVLHFPFPSILVLTNSSSRPSLQFLHLWPGREHNLYILGQSAKTKPLGLRGFVAYYLLASQP